MLRKALRESVANAELAFVEQLDKKAEIEPDEFDRVASQFHRGEKPAANAAVLDFDKKIISLAKPKDGFYTYRMKDVSTAIYYAERAHGITKEEAAVRFYDRLDGKAVQYTPWSEPASAQAITGQ